MATGTFNPVSTDTKAKGRVDVDSNLLGDGVIVTMILEAPFPVRVSLTLEGDDAKLFLRQAAMAAFVGNNEAMLAAPEWAKPKGAK